MFNPISYYLCIFFITYFNFIKTINYFTMFRIFLGYFLILYIVQIKKKNNIINSNSNVSAQNTT